ncbi:MAG: hypothetical protein SF028_14895 [Candidatus Sumerlaeia bacterium]|nr:hypothetical protein [Candidatus Sumerlaeia bacterium]
MDHVHLRHSIRLYFSEFGPDLAEALAAELVDRGGFSKLFAKIGEPLPPGNEERYQRLAEIIRQRGAARLMALLGASTRAPAADPGTPPPVPRAAAAKPAPAPAAAPAEAPPSATRAELAPATPAGRVNIPLKPGIPPKPGTFDERTPAFDPSKPRDPNGEWPAVERRSGKERRQQPDRRSSVELIYKNRRFGKERRSPKERRRNWPRGGVVPPDQPPKE